MHGSEHAQMGIGCHVCWINHGTRILIAYSLIGISMAENQSDHDGDCSAKYSVDELKSFLLHKGIPSSIVEIFSDNLIDGSEFLQLTQNELDSLVKPLGIRKKISRLIPNLKSPTSLDAQNSSEPAKKSALQQAKEMVGRLKGSVDKKTVSALFSGKSGSRSLAKRAPVTAFDPAADLLVADKKRKKQNTKPRPITITVVLLPYVQKSIPKGQQRKALEKEGRVQKIQVHRYASEDDIKVLIATTFSEVCPNLQDWMVLESSSRNQLSIIEQSLTAEYVIERRGGLYLAEATMNDLDCISSTSSQSSLPDVDLKANTPEHNMHANHDQSGSEVYAIQSNDEPCTSESSIMINLLDYNLQDQPVLNVEQSHQSSQNRSYGTKDQGLMEEQEKKYEESLKTDRKKTLLVKLKEYLLLKYSSADLSEDNAKILFKLRDGRNVTCTICMSWTTKELHEYAYSHLGGKEGVALYTVNPRTRLPACQPLSEYPLVNNSVLIVEDDPSVCPLVQFCTAVKHIDTFDSKMKRRFKERQEYLLKHSEKGCFEVKISRDSVLKDVLHIYSTTEITEFAEVCVTYIGEAAIDDGGVTRDLFSAFWEEAYKEFFDGPNQLTPALHLHTDLGIFSTLGAVMAHGYLISGILPTRIAFPALCKCLLSPATLIDAKVMIQSFLNLLLPYESAIIGKALSHTSGSFPDEQTDQLVGIVSRFGCTQLPNSGNLKNILLEIAQFEFGLKPMAALSACNSGIPKHIKDFFAAFTTEEMYNLYMDLAVSVEHVLKLLQEPTFNSKAEERVFTYLNQFISSLHDDELSKFLRFVTGSGIPMHPIDVSFCNLSGLARRPIAHTCAYELTLSTCYKTQQEFNEEFKTVLNNDACWVMDSL